MPGYWLTISSKPIWRLVAGSVSRGALKAFTLRFRRTVSMLAGPRRGPFIVIGPAKIGMVLMNGRVHLGVDVSRTRCGMFS
jgi:hypothetical protein